MNEDKVTFQGETYNLPTGATEAEIREALSDVAPAIANASLEVTRNEDGTTTWAFQEKAGVKG